MLYEDKTRPISWLKAACVSLVLSAAAFLICLTNGGGALLYQGIACAVCFVVITFFLKKKGNNPSRQCSIELYDDYFTCMGVCTKLNKNAAVPVIGQHYSYADVDFVKRDYMNLLVDIGDIRVNLFSLDNAKETEAKLKEKISEYSSLR